MDKIKEYLLNGGKITVVPPYESRKYITRKTCKPWNPKLSNIPKGMKLTKREQQILRLLSKGIDRESIRYLLNIKAGSLRMVLCRLKKKCDAFHPL